MDIATFCHRLGVDRERSVELEGFRVLQQRRVLPVGPIHSDDAEPQSWPAGGWVSWL